MCSEICKKMCKIYLRKKKSCDKSYNLIIDSVVFASKAEIDIFGNKIQMEWL